MMSKYLSQMSFGVDEHADDVGDTVDQEKDDEEVPEDQVHTPEVVRPMLKKPAAAEVVKTRPIKSKPMKRPAAVAGAGKPFKRPGRAGEQPSKNDAAAHDDGDDDNDDGNTDCAADGHPDDQRDRMKSRRFFELWGELPDSIRAEWDKATGN